MRKRKPLTGADAIRRQAHAPQNINLPMPVWSFRCSRLLHRAAGDEAAYLGVTFSSWINWVISKELAKTPEQRDQEVHQWPYLLSFHERLRRAVTMTKPEPYHWVRKRDRRWVKEVDTPPGPEELALIDQNSESGPESG